MASQRIMKCASQQDQDMLLENNYYQNFNDKRTFLRHQFATDNGEIGFCISCSDSKVENEDHNEQYLTKVFISRWFSPSNRSWFTNQTRMFKKVFQKNKNFSFPYSDVKKKVTLDWKTTKTDRVIETKRADNILKNPGGPRGAPKMKKNTVRIFTTFLLTKDNCPQLNMR